MNPESDCDNHRRRDQLVRQELGLADRIARDYRNRGIELDDLRQVAYLALIKAAERYDNSRGTRFAVYASVSINGELKRHFRDHGWGVRPPRSVQENYLTVRSSQERLAQTLARVPTIDELAEDTDLSVDAVLVALDAHAGYRSRSIDGPTDDDDGPSRRYEPAIEERGFDRVCDEVDLEQLTEQLTSRQRRIIDLRFRDELSQASIAEKIGVSQVQVSRLLRRLLETLRTQSVRIDVNGRVDNSRVPIGSAPGNP